MRRLIVGGLAATFLFVAATAAYAGIGGSRHDITNSAATAKYSFGTMALFGSCSACHIPHGATGDKLFPKTVGAGGGTFGPMCQLCHGNLSGIADPGYDLWVNNTVLAVGAHGLSVANLTARGDHHAVSASLLPYATAANIECTTCHDVHSSGKPNAALPQTQNRPFLWMTIDTLCQRCHTNKAHNTIAAVGTANVAGVSGSTHPAGAAFTGDASGRTSPINTAANWGGQLVTNNITGGSMWAVGTSWDSGFQLTGQGTTGGVSCPSCHDVHFDDGVPGGTDPAGGTNGTQYLASVDDNLTGVPTGDSQDFCEHCHRGTTPTGYAGANFPNPGGTTYTHPVDDLAAADATITANLTWMSGKVGPNLPVVGAGVSGMVCTSCHALHASDSLSKTELNTPILINHDQTAAMNICAQCHTSLGFNHHPVGGYATPGNTAGGVGCGGGNVGAGIGTCHGAGGTTGSMAHNRTSPLGAPATGSWGTNGSTYMCVKCHTVNPSAYIPTNTYTAGGQASHFVGDASALTFKKVPTTRAAAANTIRQPSTFGSTWTSNLESIYESTAGVKSNAGVVMICESCHSLKNGNLRDGDSTYVGSGLAQTTMLLERSGWDIENVNSHTSAGVVADFTTSKYLCTGCHFAPAGTHPLLDAVKARYALPATVYGQTYTATSMNCESCHSAHTAATTAGNYILDGQAGTYGTGTAMAWEPTINYSGFCAVCHADFQ